MMAAPDAMAVGYGNRLALRLITWKPLPRGNLRGFATVEILAVGLRIIDVPTFVGSNGPWVALPAKRELDRDGHRKTDINGKSTYTPVCEWRTRELSDRFSEAVIAAVRRAHPEDLVD